MVYSLINKINKQCSDSVGEGPIGEDTLLVVFEGIAKRRRCDGVGEGSAGDNTSLVVFEGTAKRRCSNGVGEGSCRN